MKVLYSRTAQGRKKQYQIITKIVLVEGEKYVWKEAACEEAKGHIKNTFQNESVIASCYGDHLVRGQMVGEKLQTPFVEGETLGGRLRRYLEEQAEKEKVRTLLQQWKNIIMGNKGNICSFALSKEFENVFGRADELIGAEATIVSNFDCSSENIFFVENDQVRIIDYEWIFPFAIPIELSFYRVLKTFFECNHGLTDWKELLTLAGVNQERCEIYERLIDGFGEYTSLDKEKHIDYALMGKKFKTGKILDRNKNTFFYRFPYELIPEGKTIILYGAGRVGEDFHKLIEMTDYCRLAAWTDKSAVLYRKQGLHVEDIETIRHCLYDYVLIAVCQEKVAEEIRKELRAFGVEKDRILWKKPRLL